MASGGKGGKKGPSMQQQLEAQRQALEMARPKDVQLQTTGWGGMGVNAPANPMQMGTAVTGQGLQAPSWAQGDWAMPWWGQQAPNVGAAMMQAAQQGPYAPQPQAPAQAQQGPLAQEAAQARTPSYGKAQLLARIRQSAAMPGAWGSAGSSGWGTNWGDNG